MKPSSARKAPPRARAAKKKPAPALAARKKPAGPTRKRSLDFGVLGMGYSDADGGSSVAGSDHGLDMSFMFSDDDMPGLSDGEDDKSSFDTPLLKVVRMLLDRMPMPELIQLVENWRVLSHVSKTKPILVGSGCSGSGMDWDVIKVINEVVLVSFCECISG